MIFCARATRGLRRPSLDARSGGSVWLLPCFFHLLYPKHVGVGDDVYPIPAAAFDAVEGVVRHLAQEFRTQWVFGGPDRRSDAHRDREQTAGCVKWHVTDRHSKAFGALS